MNEDTIANHIKQIENNTRYKVIKGDYTKPSVMNGKNSAQRHRMRSGFLCLKGPIKKIEFYPVQDTSRKRLRLIERVKKLFAKGAFGNKA